MDIVQIAGTLYLAFITTVGGWLILRRIDRLEQRVDGLPTRDELNARFDGIRNETDARFDGLRNEMNARFDNLRLKEIG